MDKKRNAGIRNETEEMLLKGAEETKILKKKYTGKVKIAE
jgi:hypothetical protein